MADNGNSWQFSRIAIAQNADKHRGFERFMAIWQFFSKITFYSPSTLHPLNPISAAFSGPKV